MENHWCADKKIKLKHIPFYVLSAEFSNDDDNEDEIMITVKSII